MANAAEGLVREVNAEIVVLPSRDASGSLVAQAIRQSSPGLG
jgi:hypothetical protein